MVSSPHPAPWRCERCQRRSSYVPRAPNYELAPSLVDLPHQEAADRLDKAGKTVMCSELAVTYEAFALRSASMYESGADVCGACTGSRPCRLRNLRSSAARYSPAMGEGSGQGSGQGSGWRSG